MNSSLPAINTILLIVNLAVTGFALDNSTKLMRYQGESAQKSAIDDNSTDSAPVQKSDLDSAVREIMGGGYIGGKNLFEIYRSIDSMDQSIKSIGFSVDSMGTSIKSTGLTCNR